MDLLCTPAEQSAIKWDHCVAKQIRLHALGQNRYNVITQMHYTQLYTLRFLILPFVGTSASMSQSGQ